jgi:hypothetical protein
MMAAQHTAKLGSGRPVTDFQLAFTDGHLFEREGCHYGMQVVPLARLSLPTGEIVAGDPSQLDTRVTRPFHQRVAPGKYPVDLAVLRKDGYAISTASMRVRFRDAPVVDWLMATTGNERLDDLTGFGLYGYGVESGLGSLADLSGIREVMRQYAKRDFDDFYDEQVSPAFDPEIEIEASHNANIELDPASGANLVVCRSGEGDGFYASYWGMGRDGEPVCLVTDFGVLIHHVEEFEELGTVGALQDARRSLDLPGGDVRLLLKAPNPRTLLMEVRGGGAGTVELHLEHACVPLSPTTTSIKTRDKGFDVEMKFEQPVPAAAELIMVYLARLEPL